MKAPATYVLWGEGDRCLYVGFTEHIGQRLTNHGNQKAWWGDVVRMDINNHESIEVARRQEGRLIKNLNPEHNVIREYVAPSRCGQPTAANLPDVLSVKQAAHELHLTERAVRHRIHAGTLAAIKLGPGTSAYVITRAEIERAKDKAVA